MAAVLSQVTLVMILAPLAAPTLGGQLLTAVGWPSIFLTLGGSGAVLWLLSWRFIRETAPPQAADTAPLRAVGKGFRTVLSHPGSLWHSLAACCASAGMFAYISGSPFVFIDVFHVSRQQFGLYFALTAGSLMVGATVNRALVAHFGPSRLLLGGVSVIVAAGLTLAGLVTFGIGGLAGVVAPMMGYLFGLGLVLPNATAGAMAPHSRLADVASSVIGGLQTIAGALAGYFVSVFFDGSPRSLGWAVAVAAILAGVAAYRARRVTHAERAGLREASHGS